MDHLPKEAMGDAGDVRQLSRVVQKPPIDFSEGVGSSSEDGSGPGMAEIEGNLVLGSSDDGAAGLEETIPNKASSS